MDTMKRNTAALVLMAGLLFVWALAPPALAAESAPPPTAASEEVTKQSGADIPTEYTGTIRPTLISAALPCQVPFQAAAGVDREQPLGDGSSVTLTSIQNPDNAYVTNLSSVPIRVSVIGVAIPSDSVTVDAGVDRSDAPAAIALKSAPADVTAPGDVFLVLGGTADTFANLAALEARALVADGGVISEINPLTVLTEVGANAREALNIYGKIAGGSAVSYGFTVLTTFRIDLA